MLEKNMIEKILTPAKARKEVLSLIKHADEYETTVACYTSDMWDDEMLTELNIEVKTEDGIEVVNVASIQGIDYLTFEEDARKLLAPIKRSMIKELEKNNIQVDYTEDYHA